MEPSKKKVQQAIISLASIAMDLPMRVYEIEDGRIAYSLTSSDIRPYCKLIHKFPEGKARCEDDENKRVNEFIDSYKSQSGTDGRMTFCHAGIYSQILPVKYEGKLRSVIIYGKVLIDDDSHKKNSLEAFTRFAAALNLNEKNRQRLEKALLTTPKIDLTKLSKIKHQLPKINSAFYSLASQEDTLSQSIDATSHEIATRIQPVMSHAENLISDLDSLNYNEIREGLNHICRCSKILSTISHNFRGSEHLGQYNMSSLSLEEIIKESIELYAPEAERYHIMIKLKMYPPDTISGSSDHLRHAFNNLVQNAVKYSFRGSPHSDKWVEISGAPFTIGSYKISIQNFGIGILKDEIEERKIFRKGYQGKLTRGEHRTGSGIGLPFANEIIEKHNGRIDVSSRYVGNTEEQVGGPHKNVFSIILPTNRP